MDGLLYLDFTIIVSLKSRIKKVFLDFKNIVEALNIRHPAEFIKLHMTKRRIKFTDKKGIGELKLLGKWDIQELIHDPGCEALYLPPYSPDLNKKEKCWSWLKSRIRKKLEQFDCLRDAIEDVLHFAS